MAGRAVLGGAGRSTGPACGHGQGLFDGLSFVRARLPVFHHCWLIFSLRGLVRGWSLGCGLGFWYRVWN